ncbi:MAG: dTMP kinase [Candidatus Bathyarchaeia archaeon]|nr:dTMP kinase [Candidatus Bathyarchaeota archaeon]
MSLKVGVFIVIEGIDGAGKTLHSKNLCLQLHRRGYPTRYTAEPSRNVIGRLLRREFLNRRKAPPEVETLLFAADRLQHLREEVMPTLRRGGIVVSDRYLYASIAYQGAQKVDIEWIRCVNSFAPKPDLAIYLDVPADVAMSRIRRGRSLMERLEFEKRVRAIYLKLVKDGELTYVDGDRPVEDVDEDILNLTIEAITKKHRGAR